MTDRHFLDELIAELEEKAAIKLFITDRDLMPGMSENVAIAELIESRCKRVILLLSNAYLSDRGSLSYELIFSQSLAPMYQRTHKLIPILLENCEMRGTPGIKTSMHSLRGLSHESVGAGFTISFLVKPHCRNSREFLNS